MSDSVWASGSAIQKVVRITDAQNFTFNSEDGPSFILPTVAFPTVAELTVDVDGLLQTAPDNFGYVVAERRLTFAADLPAGLKVHVSARGKSEIEVPQSTRTASPLGQALIRSADVPAMHSVLGLGTIVSANAEDVQAALRFQDDGSPVAGTDTINFVGAGVAVANVGGVVVVTIPGGLAAPAALSTNTALSSNARYSYSASLILTLPPSPANGGTIIIYNTGTVLTTVVERNGKTIMGLAQDMTLDIANKKFVFEYLSASGDWRLGA